jgi:hypothetical protein
MVIEGGPIEMVAVCCNMIGALRIRLISRIQTGRTESGIDLTTTGSKCIVVLEIWIVQGVGGGDGDEVVSSCGRITLAEEDLMVKGIGTGKCDRKVEFATEGSVAMPSCRQLDENSCWDITAAQGYVIQRNVDRKTLLQ